MSTCKPKRRPGAISSGFDRVAPRDDERRTRGPAVAVSFRREGLRSVPFDGRDEVGDRLEVPEGRAGDLEGLDELFEPRVDLVRDEDDVAVARARFDDARPLLMAGRKGLAELMKQFQAIVVDSHTVEVKLP